MGEKIDNGTIQIGEIIGKTLDGRDIYKFTELGMAENVKIIAPQYKDGDFVISELDSILIFKEADGDRVFDHAFLPACGGLSINKVASYEGVKRHASTEEKQRMIEALAELGKRWNKDKKCVEDISKRKFKAGDKVRIRHGISSKTHRNIGPSFVEEMDDLIGKTMTVSGYTQSGSVVCYESNWRFHEDWLEPYVEGLKKGDLAIFWDDGCQYRASVRMYGGLVAYDYLDTGGVRWDNAIKFESKEQYEKLINGEL